MLYELLLKQTDKETHGIYLFSINADEQEVKLTRGWGGYKMQQDLDLTCDVPESTIQEEFHCKIIIIFSRAQP